MSIAFTCTCGKKLQAPDEFAGRRMKCKGCGEVLPIPGKQKPVAAKAAQKVAAPKGKPPAPKVAAKPTPPPPPAKKPPSPPPKPAAPVNAPQPAAQPPRAEPNPWADRSLEQRSIPWQHGDDLVAGAREAERKGVGIAGLLVVLLLLGVAGGGVWFVWLRA